LIFHRSQLVKALYDGLPENAKNRYLSSKKVNGISLTSTGVEVTCADGTFYPGSIVIGADGAHSKTRSIMRQLALEVDPPLASAWDPEQPFTATYRCLWGSVDRTSNPGDSYETQGRDRSTVYLKGVDKSWIFIYEKLPQRSKARVTYSEKEIQSFKASFADWPLNRKLRVQDVLEASPNMVGMANLEEGIAKNISWNGLIVLVGDAWHKFTPNSGLGFNNGIQDAVSLCNQLHALSASSQLFTSDGSLNTKALQDAFDGYHLERKRPLQADYARSARATRLSAWETSNHYILARYILPLERLQKFLINRHISPGIASGLVLDYIPATEALLGKVPWDNPLTIKRDQSKQSQ
jgi:2-polyprenyl-6-methoxyphenol hydroxylase-like FAD-dependent oxidoreductase